jgi:competence protein ComEC
MLVSFAIGFNAAKLKTEFIDAPVLTERLGPRIITGTIQSIEYKEKGLRVLLKELSIENFKQSKTPKYIRIFVRKKDKIFKNGDVLKFKAILRTPPPPVAPHAYDFQRAAYFKQIGSLGYSISPIEIIGHKPVSTFSEWLQQTRNHITKTIYETIDGQTGAIITALITGERSMLKDETYQIFRDSGLAHLLAISGLHIGLIAGFLFIFLRTAFAFIPQLSRRYNTKKFAAIGALFGALFYTMLAGGAIPTLRAFLMLSLVFTAILLDRRALSMRTIAFAALLILIFIPESLITPSFQMSFAAVLALIGFYEFARTKFKYFATSESFFVRLLFYFIALSITSLIASIATTPYAIYHFNQIQFYGILANLIAIPLMGFWIMPWALFSLFLMLFDFTWPLQIMAYGIDIVAKIATYASSIPGSTHITQPYSTLGISLFTVGALWLLLWQTRWRIFGLIPMSIAFLPIMFQDTPDILVSQDAKLIGIKDNGRYMLSSIRGSKYAAKMWKQQNGITEQQLFPYKSVTTRYEAIKNKTSCCDNSGCLFKIKDRLIAVPASSEALSQDCKQAQIVIGNFPFRRRCKSAIITIDRFDVWREGAHAVFISDTINKQTVIRLKGYRPWCPQVQ